jgi:TonB-linked SusC/RagA family outer membrane protein
MIKVSNRSILPKKCFKKLSLIMKLNVILLILTTLQSMAVSYSQNARVSINVKDGNIVDIFNAIENQSEFRIFYRADEIDLDKKYTVDYENEPVGNMLSELFNGSKFTYELVDKIIVITSYKQQPKISGKVTDATTGDPLPGVYVRIEGTNTGSVTDVEGNYTVDVPAENAVLQFSFVGYITENVLVAGRSQINVSMVAELTALEEVIVVGYGTQTKRTVTGSIQSVNSDDIKNIPVSQVTQSLQGKLAGVQINQASGIPGKGMLVRVRGAGSISAGSDPLYVVDGFPVTGDVSNINAEEIESISILKDASSTSLYGSRAANGVVLITTKQGKQGKTEIGFNAYYGTQVLPEKGRPDMMNGTEFAQFKKESYEDLGVEVPAAFQNPGQYGDGYDWYNIMFRKAPIQDYTLTLSSSTEKFNASAIAGYFKQDGILINSGYERFSIRVNTGFKVNDAVKLGFNIAPSYSTAYTPSTEGIFWMGGLLSNALQTWPIVPYKNPDGTLPLTAWLPGAGGFPAPNYYRAAQEIKTTTNTTRLLSNAYISVEPIKGLILKSTINVEYGPSNSRFFNPSTSSTGFATMPPITARAVYSNGSAISWLSENTATFTKAINNHNFEILAGYTVQKSTASSQKITVTNFADDRISDVDAATVIQMDGTDSDLQKWSLISYIGRINYNFKDKYLFSAAIRRDGSSRFGSDNLWGNFPSVSLGWIASEEKFFPGNDIVTFLKVRGSYGLTGNNNIGNYTHWANVNLGDNTIFGSTVTGGSYVANLANPYLGWEKSSQLDIGTDIGFLNNRISLAYDYYMKRTTDLLYDFTIPQSSGFSTFTGNSGELKFWGHEIAVTSHNLVGNLKWDTQVNLTFGDNEVVSLAPNVDAIYSGGHISKVGQRLGLFWGLIQEGVYVDQADYDNSPKASQSAVGTIKFKDVNKDGQILNTNTGGDVTVIGDPTPKFLYGITNTVNFRNLDFSLVLSGSYGNDIANRYEQGTTNLDGVFNVLKEVKYRWRSPENPGRGKYGTTTKSTGMERDWFNSRFIHDGSFLTIKNITLGYTINSSKLRFINSVRLYASAQQVYTFTKYPGNNVEVTTAAPFGTVSVLTLGDDYSSYPVPRTYTFGINLQF